ncbi:hypothetical protein COC42_10740 [Sphingomonas spermidinifaciens]|uniref:Bacteriophage phiJL001 Gp84 C-terminal domain-containing protein n=1 Tax=Sphingomonas spermidinifaciens TaxID=1141889 RepID=A0A2A4B1P4_9SPHN|nr:DUF2163 domain-containing protein [Sphingomonas spermidinifaciens]PCD01967.1 hypothetical protein COC42_10740 [Sphingomonas spermidinifaciens]
MSWLAETCATIAFCWRVERRDGVAIGLTSHDRDLVIEGIVHRAAPGISPSAIKRSDGLDADSMDVTGALTHRAIGERDLIAGRWDGARVAISAVDWTNVANRVPLGEGTIGAIETADGGFTAELRGASAAFEAPACEVTSPECRAELGDGRCRVPMAARRRVVRVVAVADATLTVDTAEPGDNLYGSGRLRWLDGDNSGLEAAIDRSAGTAVKLREPPRLPVRAGDRAELIEGCDKRLATCAGRFGNAANFRGEPFLPGIDLLTRYPGA